MLKTIRNLSKFGDGFIKTSKKTIFEVHGNIFKLVFLILKYNTYIYAF